MELFSYQQEGVEFLSSRARCLLADSMGLGKTAQAISAAKKLNLKHILVVCPASLRLNWGAEIRRWWPEGFDRFYVVSYNYCQKEENIVLINEMKPWDLLICDEAHALKSWKSKQTKNIILGVARMCDRVWLLTGTPATRSAADYHPLLSVIEPGKHGKFKEFASKYCLSKPGFGYNGAIQYYGFKNTDELKNKVKAVGLRRLKKDVLSQLPGKIYTTLPVILDDRELDVDDYVLVTEAFNRGSPDESLASKLHELGLEKVKSALDWINSSEEPLVVFAWHRDVIEKLMEGCSRDAGAIHGGTSAESKQRIVDDFQKGELDVLFLNIAAGGVGITLTRSNHVLFVEPTWSPALMLQAEDRVHRIGQAAECVNVYHLVANNTVDELVFRNLDMKKHGINAVLKSE